MADIREFLVPDLGEGLEEAQIVEWHVDAGDVVELNQDVCEVETAKALVGIPSPFAGTVVERFGEVGQSVDVGSPLLRIDVTSAAEVQRNQPDSAAAASNETAPKAVENTRQSVLVGYGAEVGPKRRRRRAAESDEGPSGGSAKQRPRRTQTLAKPPVRKLAKDLNVDLAGLAPGSGPEGSITREDVQAAAPDVPAASTAPSARPGERIPLHGIRGRIAQKMVTSRSEIPEATCSITIDCTDLVSVAKDLTSMSADEDASVKVTPLVLIIKAATSGLRRHPEVNSRLDTDAQEIVLLDDVNVGVAMDTKRGLIVPVIRGTDQLSTLDVARELTRLVDAARSGSVRPTDMTGGTFTVNNYGALGTEDGEPIINHPEAAILGVGAIRQRAWVVDGEVVARPVARLTLAFDHRILDGGTAARFLTYVGAMAEHPSGLLLHG